MDLVTPIVSASAALLGALGTQYLTGRRARLALADERAWQMRKEAREVSHGVIVAASTLNVKLSMLVQMVASLRAQGADKDVIIEAFAEESIELQTGSVQLTEALVRFRLSFADRVLVDKATDVAAASDRMAFAVPQFLAAISESPELEVAAKSFLSHARSLATALKAFDSEAIARLSEPLQIRLDR